MNPVRRNDFERDMTTAVGFAIVATVLGLLTGCHNKEHTDQQNRERRMNQQGQGKDAPAPNPAVDPPPKPQPVPSLSDNASRPVTLECIWRGRRWVEMTVLVNNEPVTGWNRRQVKYTDDGVSSDPASGGGTATKNVSVKKGDTVSVTCTPMPDRPNGYMSAWVKFFNNPRDFQQTQSGPATAGWQVNE